MVVKTETFDCHIGIYYPVVNLAGSNSSERYLSSLKPEHTTGGSRWDAGWQGGVGQECLPIELCSQRAIFPRTLQNIEDASPKRFSRKTNKEVFI